MPARFPSLSALLLVLLGLACASTPSPESTLETEDAELQRLARWMSGTFSSALQATEQPHDFLSIRIVATPIWPRRDDGPWLYVEEAATGSPERPYRQRVLHLSRAADGGLVSAIFELPGNAQHFAGAWRGEERFAELEPRDLSPRAGCSIQFEVQEGAFAGATSGTGCVSRIGAAAYATSIMRLTEDHLERQERGFAANGQQVWGPTRGAYRFDRLSDGAPR